MATFDLQIVTPDGEFFDGPAERVICRAIDGDVCILPRHVPYVTALGIGEVRVMIDGKVRRAACSGGLLSVAKLNEVRLVASTFEWAEDIDHERAERARAGAEEAVRHAKDAAELELAKARLSRALVRLKVSQS